MTSASSEPATRPATGSPEEGELFRGLAEGLPLLAWTARPDGRRDHFNGKWLEYTGLPSEQAHGDGWLHALHPDDREQAFARWTSSVRAGEPHEAVYRLRRAADGAFRWFVARATPLRGPDGQIFKWLGTATDIDDQKRAADVQEFLASAGEELASSLDHEVTLRRLARLAVPKLGDWCAVDLLEPEGKLRRVTVTHTDPAKEALVMALVERYPPDPTDPNDGLYRVVRTGQSERMADIPPALLDLAARDAGHLEILRALDLRSYMAVPLKARGRTLGVFSVVAAESRRSYTPGDLAITEDLARRAALAIDNARLFQDLQRSSAEIRRMNEELEAHVHERTAQLEDANRELEAFCYSISHDLRAPLRHIAGFAQLLEKRAGSSLDEEGRRHVETIRESARQGAMLVDDLLNFSRLGRSELTKVPVSLAELVALVQQKLSPETEGRVVTFRVGDLPVVEADPTLLRSVIKNLLGNAIKYTRSRAEAVIEISARESADEVELCVRDNGVGFDPRFVDKLFGVFQRLHTAEEFEGNGIGLASVRRIIARHGGRTWAEGEMGRGAAFHFTLPRIEKGTRP